MSSCANTKITSLAQHGVQDIYGEFDDRRPGTNIYSGEKRDLKSLKEKCPFCGKDTEMPLKPFQLEPKHYKCPCTDVVWHKCMNRPRGKILAAVTDPQKVTTAYYEEGDVSGCTARRSSKNYKAMVAACNIEDARALAHVLADTPELHKQMDVKDGDAPLHTEVEVQPAGTDSNESDVEDDEGPQMTLRCNYALSLVLDMKYQLKDSPQIIFFIIEGRDAKSLRNFDTRMVKNLYATDVVFCMFQSTARDLDVRRCLVGRDNPTPIGWRFHVTRKAIAEHTLEDFSNIPTIAGTGRKHFSAVLCVKLVEDYKLAPLPLVDAPEEEDHVREQAKAAKKAVEKHAKVEVEAFFQKLRTETEAAKGTVEKKKEPVTKSKHYWPFKGEMEDSAYYCGYS